MASFSDSLGKSAVESKDTCPGRALRGQQFPSPHPHLGKGRHKATQWQCQAWFPHLLTSGLELIPATFSIVSALLQPLLTPL